MADDDLGQRLADAASALAPERAVDPVPIADRARRSHRRRGTARAGVLVVAALVVGAIGVDQIVGSEDDPAVETSSDGFEAGGWERVPDGPLSGRVGATAVWTGEEVVVVGGSTYLCPPSADCGGPIDPPFSDGAAYDPSTREWRSIAPAPVAFYGEGAVAVAGDLYFLVSCAIERFTEDDIDPCPSTQGDVAFTRYDADADEWTLLDPPPMGRDYGLSSVGRYVVAFTESDERGESPDLIFDTESSTWQEIPDDPMPAVFDRTVVSSAEGEAFILIGAPTAGLSDQSQDNNAVARFDLANRTWEALPPPPGRGYRGWEVDDLVVLEPHFGGHGGSLDPATDVWSELPPGPDVDGWENQISGVIGRTDAVYTDAAGWLLDVSQSRWIEISPPDGRETFPFSNVTAVGRDMFLFGGDRWDGGNGELLGDAWIWRAPGPTGSSEGSTTTTVTKTPKQQSGELTIELVDPPGYTEGFDLAVRITPADEATIERQLEDFVSGAGQQPGFMESSSISLDVPSGSVMVQAHLTIGQGPGPREPDFVDQFDGSLCSPLEIAVPAGGTATARMDWKTGCLESESASEPAPSDLLPERQPDVVGVISGPNPGEPDQRLQLTISTGQDEYYDQAFLNPEGGVIVGGASGDQVSAEELSRGTRVDVWTAGCAESSPVICEIEAIRIRP